MKYLRACLSLALVTACFAADAAVMRTSNSYSVMLGDSHGRSEFTNLTFDGRSHLGYRQDEFGQEFRRLMIREGEVDLGDGKHQLNLQINALNQTAGGNNDLFPTYGDGISVSFGADKFDLAAGYRLDSLFLRFYRGSELLAERNIVEEFGHEFGSLSPWDGGLFARSSGLGFTNGGGLGISTIEWEFNLSELPTQVPEPASLAIACMGLGLMVRKVRR